MVITCRDVSVRISIQTRLGPFSPNYGSLATQDYKTNTLGYTYHTEGNSDAGKSWQIWWMVMDSQNLTIQIFCYYKFPWRSCVFSLLGIILTWLVAKTTNNNFFLCCHCFYIMGNPNLPRSQTYLRLIRSSPPGQGLHFGIFTRLTGCPRVSLKVQWTP